ASAPPDTYTLSLHDALPISRAPRGRRQRGRRAYGAELRRGTGSVRLLPPAPGAGRVRPADRPAADELRSAGAAAQSGCRADADRSEEHTSELQSRENLVCRL